jgi:diguanylate cyclase (GGDEF)-like protein/PAS domain S-box-containing protein
LPFFVRLARQVAYAAAAAFVAIVASLLAITLVPRFTDLTMFWPGTALIVGFMLHAPRDVRAALLVGLAAGTVAISAPVGLVFTLVKLVVNVTEAVVLTQVMRRGLTDGAFLDGIGRVVRMIGSVVAVSAVAGLATAPLFVSDHTPTLLRAWLMWVAVDITSVFLVLPVFLAWQPHHLRACMTLLSTRGWLRSGLEFGLIVALALSAIVLLARTNEVILLVAIGNLMIWIALRFGLIITTASTGLIGITAVVFVTNGELPAMGALRLQFAMASIALPPLIVGTALASRERALHALRVSQAQLALALDGAKEGLWDWRMAEGVLYTDDRYAALLGYGPGELPTDENIWATMVHPEDEPGLLAMTAMALDGSRDFFEVELRMRRKDGSYVWLQNRGTVTERDATGYPLRAIGTGVDVTARKKLEQRIRFMATHDPLTELANRALFDQEFERRCADAVRTGNSLALLLVDVDRFKQINDIHGHPVGDRVLIEIAHRLRAAVRPGDLVSRLGGDEFAVLASASPGQQAVLGVARRITRALAEPVDVDGMRITLGASLGAALCPANARDPEALLACADEALYRAKKAGRGTWRLSRHRHRVPAPSAVPEMPGDALAYAATQETAGAPDADAQLIEHAA